MIAPAPLVLALLALVLLALAPLALVLLALALLALHQTPEDQLSTDPENESLLVVSLARRRASKFIARSKSSITSINSLSISSIISGYTGPPIVLATIISICQAQGTITYHA